MDATTPLLVENEERYGTNQVSSDGLSPQALSELIRSKVYTCIVVVACVSKQRLATVSIEHVRWILRVGNETQQRRQHRVPQGLSN